jgi:hypothetical protein
VTAGVFLLSLIDIVGGTDVDGVGDDDSELVIVEYLS